MENKQLDWLGLIFLGFFLRNDIGLQVSIGNSPLKNEAKISTKHLIPVKIAQPGDQGTTLGDFLYKQKYNLK